MSNEKFEKYSDAELTALLAPNGAELADGELADVNGGKDLLDTILSVLSSIGVDFSGIDVNGMLDMGNCTLRNWCLKNSNRSSACNLIPCNR